MTDHHEEAAFGRDIREYIDTSGHWLDYTINQDFTSTAPPPRLLRFMPLEQYLSILTSRQLYIPRATEYEDPYDCAFPGSLADEIRESLVASCDEPEFSLSGEFDHSKLVEEAEDILATELADRFALEIPQRWFVSCWHAGEALTDLMWRSYGGHKGVCIACDGPSLLRQIRDTIWVRRNALSKDRGLKDFEFLHGFVDYEPSLFDISSDDEMAPIVTVRHPAFHKHHFFRLDTEYRFAAKLTSKDTAYYAAGASLDLSACNASVSTSPLCPDWISKSVEAVTRAYFPDIPFKRLDLEVD